MHLQKGQLEGGSFEVLTESENGWNLSDHLATEGGCVKYSGKPLIVRSNDKKLAEVIGRTHSSKVALRKIPLVDMSGLCPQALHTISGEVAFDLLRLPAYEQKYDRVQLFDIAIDNDLDEDEPIISVFNQTFNMLRDMRFNSDIFYINGRYRYSITIVVKKFISGKYKSYLCEFKTISRS